MKRLTFLFSMLAVFVCQAQYKHSSDVVIKGNLDVAENITARVGDFDKIIVNSGTVDKTMEYVTLPGGDEAVSFSGSNIQIDPTERYFVGEADLLRGEYDPMAFGATNDGTENVTSYFNSVCPGGDCNNVIHPSKGTYRIDDTIFLQTDSFLKIDSETLFTGYGTIIGDQSRIDAGDYQWLAQTIDIGGTWLVDWQPTWFGGKFYNAVEESTPVDSILSHLNGVGYITDYAHRNSINPHKFKKAYVLDLWVDTLHVDTLAKYYNFEAMPGTGGESMAEYHGYSNFTSWDTGDMWNSGFRWLVKQDLMGMPPASMLMQTNDYGAIWEVDLFNGGSNQIHASGNNFGINIMDNTQQKSFSMLMDYQATTFSQEGDIILNGQSVNLNGTNTINLDAQSMAITQNSIEWFLKEQQAEDMEWYMFADLFNIYSSDEDGSFSLSNEEIILQADAGSYLTLNGTGVDISGNLEVHGTATLPSIVCDAEMFVNGETEFTDNVSIEGDVYINGPVECGDIDVRGIVMFNHSSAPSSPVMGQIYFNANSQHFYGWTLNSWVQLDN